MKLHLSDVNKYFTSLASHLTCKINEPYDFTEFFQNISDDEKVDTFKIKHTNYNEVQKILLKIRNDCSTCHYWHFNTMLNTSFRRRNSTIDSYHQPMH